MRNKHTMISLYPNEYEHIAKQARLSGETPMELMRRLILQGSGYKNER